jgi:hypothetical protein
MPKTNLCQKMPTMEENDFNKKAKIKVSQE